MRITTQPQIPASYQLLFAGFVYGNLTLDLHGTADADGAEVCAVSLTRTLTDLEDVISGEVFERAQDWLDTHGARLLAQDRQHAAVDHYEFERMAA